jgi:hypothetical protein
VETLHCYAYNECDKEIVVTVTYAPLEGDKERVDEIRVTSGAQRMLCTTHRNWVSLEAHTADGANHWSRLELPLVKTESTHVLAGVVSDRNHAPDRWPEVTTRQYACPAAKPPSG